MLLFPLMVTLLKASSPHCGSVSHSSSLNTTMGLSQTTLLGHHPWIAPAGKMHHADQDNVSDCPAPDCSVHSHIQMMGLSLHGPHLLICFA